MIICLLPVWLLLSGMAVLMLRAVSKIWSCSVTENLPIAIWDMEHWNALKTGRAPHRKKKVATVFAIRDFRDEDVLLDDPDDIIDKIEEFYQ